MKKILLFIFLIGAIGLTSCNTPKRIQKKLDKYCPLCPTKDSTVTVIKYRDTTITIPGETVEVVDTLYCDSLGNVYSKRLYEKDGVISRLETQLSNNKYKTRVVVDTIYKTIQGNTVYKDRVQVKKIEIEKKYIPGFVSFLSWVGGIFLLLLLIYIAFRIITKSIKII